MNVLIPIDGSDQALQTIAMAGKFLNRQISLIYLLTVKPPMEAFPWCTLEDVLQTQRDLERAKFRADIAGLKVQNTAHVFFDSPSFAICNYANRIKANLIVIGTHGYQGFAKFLIGSVTRQVLEKSTQPVIMVRNDKSNAVRINNLENASLAL